MLYVFSRIFTMLTMLIVWQDACQGVSQDVFSGSLEQPAISRRCLGNHASSDVVFYEKFRHFPTLNKGVL